MYAMTAMFTSALRLSLKGALPRASVGVSALNALRGRPVRCDERVRPNLHGPCSRGVLVQRLLISNANERELRRVTSSGRITPSFYDRADTKDHLRFPIASF